MVCIFCLIRTSTSKQVNNVVSLNMIYSSFLYKLLFIISSVCRLINSDSISTIKGPTPIQNLSRDKFPVYDWI